MPVAGHEVAEILDDLNGRGLSCAPHVLTRLIARLGRHPSIIRDVVARLEPAQRHGLRSLPSPLPDVASIAARYDGLDLHADDRRLLLAASLCLDDALDPLLAFDGRAADEIVSGALGAHLELHAGRVRFVDPLLAVWIRASSSAAERNEVHARLSEVFRGSAETVSADWHRARASLHRAADTAPELTRIARELSEAGNAERALLLAAEAVSHATGEVRDEARVVAGAAAIASGYAVDAAAWLGGLFPDGAERFRLQGLGAFVVALAHLRGTLDGLDPTQFRPRSRDAQDRHAWARAAGLAGVLCAERGDRRGMRSWLDALRDAGDVEAGAGELRESVFALAWTISGERDAVDAAEGTGPVTGAVLRAVRAAMAGDLDAALGAIAGDAPGQRDEVDPFVAGFEHSPLVRAYRAVLESLLLTWRGDIGLARERLGRASMTLPVAMPFAGLGVVLSRRLDLAVTGRIGPVAGALTAILPTGLRFDRFVDRAIEAYLAGSFAEAAANMRLWVDGGRRRHVLSIPGLDEAGPDSATEAVPRPGVAPPDVARAERLRTLISSTPEARWPVIVDHVADDARTLSSPFSRGRVEAMIGIRYAVRDEVAPAREHLRTAATLFAVAGADAWTRATERRVAQLDADVLINAAASDPLSACRRVWEPLLTPRELGVAMLAVQGASNRDIGDALNVSVRTVEVHLGRAFAKLGVRSRVELTVLAHRTGQRR